MSLALRSGLLVAILLAASFVVPAPASAQPPPPGTYPRDADGDGDPTNPCIPFVDDDADPDTECYTPTTIEPSDCDYDGTGNLDEIRDGSDACNPGTEPGFLCYFGLGLRDQDGDGFPDCVELLYGTNYTDDKDFPDPPNNLPCPAAVPGCEPFRDSDHDVWYDLVENLTSPTGGNTLSDPENASSTPLTDDDGDGCNNFLEWAAGTNRTDPEDSPPTTLCGSDAAPSPSINITHVNNNTTQTSTEDGSLFVPSHKQRFVTVNGTTSPSTHFQGVDGAERTPPVRAVFLNLNGRNADPVCRDVQDSNVCILTPPGSYNPNVNSPDVPGGDYWKIATPTGPNGNWSTWTITFDLQADDIVRDGNDDGFTIPVQAWAYAGPFNESRAVEDNGLNDGSCVQVSTVCAAKRDTRVPLTPVPGSPEWGASKPLKVEFVQDHVPVVSVSGKTGPDDSAVIAIHGHYEDSSDAAVSVTAIICKQAQSTQLGKHCGDRYANMTQDDDCAPDAEFPVVRVNVTCSWTINITGAHKENLFYQFNFTDEHGYVTQATVTDYKYQNIQSVVANVLCIDGDCASKTVRNETVTLSGRVEDKGLGNAISSIEITVKTAKEPFQTLLNKVPVTRTDDCQATPGSGLLVNSTVCFEYDWDLTDYGLFLEGVEYRVTVTAVDEEGFDAKGGPSALVGTILMDRNTPPTVVFREIELEDGTLYVLDPASGDWTLGGEPVAQPILHGNVTIRLGATDPDVDSADAQLDLVSVSVGKAQPPFVISMPKMDQAATPLPHQVQVENIRMCEVYNAATEAAEKDMCDYNLQDGLATEAGIKRTLDENITGNTGWVNVTEAPGYILTERGTLVVSFDPPLLSTGFTECLQSNYNQARDDAESEDPGAPEGCTANPEEEYIHGDKLDFAADVQLGDTEQGLVCGEFYHHPGSTPAIVTNELKHVECPTQVLSFALVNNWLVAVQVLQEDGSGDTHYVSVTTACDNAGAWCSTSLSNKESEVQINDYDTGDNDGEYDGDMYDQVDRSVEERSKTCRSGNPPMCPSKETLLYGYKPLFNATQTANDATGGQVGDTPPQVRIPFGELADTLGINGMMIPLTVEGVDLKGMLVTPSDFQSLLGNATCYEGGYRPPLFTVPRTHPDDGRFDCRGPSRNFGYVNRIVNPEDPVATYNAFLDPPGNPAPRYAIPRGFNWVTAGSSDAHLVGSNWTVEVDLCQEQPNRKCGREDGWYELFAAGRDNVEDFFTSAVCDPALCTPSTLVRINNALDLDGDCYKDADEVAAGSDPNDASSVPADLDEDCIPDVVDLDIDGDGLTNEQEEEGFVPEWPRDHDRSVVTTDPYNADTDGDGYSDFAEFEAGTHPRDPRVHPNDLDGDGYSNDGEELSRAIFPGCGPNDPNERTPFDQDGDGFYDWEEILYGSSRCDAGSKPSTTNVLYALDLDRDRVPDALEPLICSIDAANCVGNDWHPPVDFNTQVFDPGSAAAYNAAGCAGLAGGNAFASLVGEGDPQGVADELQAALVNCVLLAATDTQAFLNNTPVPEPPPVGCEPEETPQECATRIADAVQTLVEEKQKEVQDAARDALGCRAEETNEGCVERIVGDNATQVQDAVRGVLGCDEGETNEGCVERILTDNATQAQDAVRDALGCRAEETNEGCVGRILEDNATAVEDGVRDALGCRAEEANEECFERILTDNATQVQDSVRDALGCAEGETNEECFERILEDNATAVEDGVRDALGCRAEETNEACVQRILTDNATQAQDAVRGVLGCGEGETNEGCVERILEDNATAVEDGVRDALGCRAGEANEECFERILTDNATQVQDAVSQAACTDGQPQLCAPSASDADVSLLSLQTEHTWVTGQWRVFSPTLGTWQEGTGSSGPVPGGPHDGTWIVVFRPDPVPIPAAGSIKVSATFQVGQETGTLRAYMQSLADSGQTRNYSPLVWVFNLHEQQHVACQPVARTYCEEVGANLDQAQLERLRFFLPGDV